MELLAASRIQDLKIDIQLECPPDCMHAQRLHAAMCCQPAIFKWSIMAPVAPPAFTCIIWQIHTQKQRASRLESGSSKEWWQWRKRRRRKCVSCQGMG